MNWLVIVGFGACGGVLVSVLDFYTYLHDWRQARRSARTGRRHRKPVPLTDYVDLGPDLLTLLTRTVLGAVAVAIFRAQIVGPGAAIAVGASAPALLRQLGAERAVPAEKVTGTKVMQATSIPKADMTSELPEEG